MKRTRFFKTLSLYSLSRSSFFLLSLLMLFSFFPLVKSMAVESKIKDLVTIKGVRENPIIGYGLVVGLSGTGDSSGQITDESVKQLLQTMGLNIQREVSSKNIASVVVTGMYPPFARMGQKIDVHLSSIADAKSLEGGKLLITELKGGDGETYALASGNLSLNAGKQASLTSSGIILSGATIEKEFEYNFQKKKGLRLNLNNPDFTTAARMEKIINASLGGKYASAKDASTIDLIIPSDYTRDLVTFISLVENFKVHTDLAAKIIINEKTGTIVAGGDITLSPVALSHGDLSLEIAENQEANQGDSSEEGPFKTLKGAANLNELVESLSHIGANSQDIISILFSLKKSGALVGEIEII